MKALSVPENIICEANAMENNPGYDDGTPEKCPRRREC